MLEVSLVGDRLRIGERLIVSFHRTLRIPDDGRTYPLPPGLGLLPALPWRGVEGSGTPEIIVPLWQREALWLGFTAAPWKPNAVKVIVGGINAVSGLPDEGATLGEPQDYLLAPDQPWLDGFNAGGGVIRQFVAMPLGQGYAIEAGAGRPEQGGIEIVGVEPLPGRFPDTPPPPRPGPVRLSRPAAAGAEPREMALGAGGRMHQKIYPDHYGRDVWDLANTGRARVRLLNGRRWRELTGRDPPPSPIDAAAYTAAGLPWFALYDEDEAPVPPDERRSVKTIAERDRELDAPTSEASVDVPVSQVTAIDRKTGDTADGGQRGRSDAQSPPPATPGKR
jgi:hypothetical protein